MTDFSNTLNESLKNITHVFMDVDGVLTDGRLYYGADGEALKVFHSLDGHGIKLLKRAGIKTGIISGRASKALDFRAHELGFDYCFTAIQEKLPFMLEKFGKQALSTFAYIGDDVPDLPLLEACSVSFAVHNAHPSLHKKVTLMTKAAGGLGAVRECCDLILQHKTLDPKKQFET